MTFDGDSDGVNVGELKQQNSETAEWQNGEADSPSLFYCCGETVEWQTGKTDLFGANRGPTNGPPALSRFHILGSIKFATVN